MFNDMRLRHAVLFFLFAFATTGLSAHQAPRTKGPLIGERNKSMEDELAKSFEAVRLDAKLPPLTRIKHRSSLEQRVCTIVQTGDSSKLGSADLIASFRTVPAASGSDLLTKAALQNKQNTEGVLFDPRYSIAVWQVTNSTTGETTYWVGFGRYRSALEEFVDYHFTDGISYRNLWKQGVAHVCRGN